MGCGASARFNITGTTVQDFYDFDKKKLGEGAFGYTNKAWNKATGALRAVKTISIKQMKDIDRFNQEIAIMKACDHPNIVKLYESFEDHQNIYLVLEMCEGGELFDRISEARKFNEHQAAFVMQQMFKSIFYMHENQICHLDLKPENFLFLTNDPIEKTQLKVIDFGLAAKFTKDQVLTTVCGTPYYVAPEVLKGKYGQGADLWSLGVIMYVLLCGYCPFNGDDDSKVLDAVKQGNYEYRAKDWKTVTKEAKNLINGLLKMDPNERLTAEQALQHTWVVNKAPQANDASLPTGLVDNLRVFRSQNKLKKAALHEIARQLGETQIKKLRETFEKLDTNKNGMLTHSEMKEGLEKAGLKEIPEDLQHILEDVDKNSSGVIDYTEFLAAALDKKVYQLEDTCWQAFRVFDKDGDGKISKEELQQVISDENVKENAVTDLEALMKELDENDDGGIEFKEFMKMMRGDTTGNKN